MLLVVVTVSLLDVNAQDPVLHYIFDNNLDA